jgi:hypothetical protein
MMNAAVGVIAGCLYSKPEFFTSTLARKSINAFAWRKGKQSRPKQLGGRGRGGGGVAHSCALVVQVSVMKRSLAVAVNDRQQQGLSTGCTGRRQSVDEAHVTCDKRHHGCARRQMMIDA